MKVRIRQINDLKKAFPVGKVLVLQVVGLKVVGVDNVKGYIDLIKI